LIKDGFIEAAKQRQFKATAIVYEIRTTLPAGVKSDAIAVSLNHRDDYSVVVIFPYKINTGEVEFGSTFAQKGEADIFTTQH
jgi:hypothetical protein